MNPIKFLVVKIFLFAAFLVYLIGDLYIWHGFVFQHLEPGSKDLQTHLGDASPVRVEVFGESITENQIARRAAELAQVSGKKELAQTAVQRGIARADLIRSAILRIKARYNDREFPNLRGNAERELQREESRFESPALFEAALKSQGFTREAWLDRLETRLKEEFLLRRAAAHALQITDDELKTGYELVKDELAVPPSRECSQIFFSTLNRDPETVKAHAETLLRRLVSGEDYETLARAFSEDERSRTAGGRLGLVFDSPRRPLPELPLFDIKAVPENTPVLLRSRWGWHLIKASPIIPSRVPSLDEIEPSLRSAILSARQELATRIHFNTLLREGFFKKTIRNHDQ